MPTAAARQHAPALPIRLPSKRDVYRCTDIVPGMITYFAVTGMGGLLDGKMVSVLPGPVAEACALADLTRALDAHDGHIAAHVPLTLHRSRRPVASSASSAPSLSLAPGPQ